MHYQINLHPQVDSLDGTLLPSLIALWLDDIHATASQLSHESYRIQIAPVLRWWHQRASDLHNLITKTTLRDLPNWLAKTPAPRTHKPLGWHSQNDALRRLRQCLHWACTNHHIPIDCSIWVPNPNVDVDLPKVRRRARLDDLAALLQAARTGPAPSRDVALIAMLIGTGVRRAEVRGLDIEDLLLDADQSGSVIVRDVKRVEGATMQGRTVAIDCWTGRYVADWLTVRNRSSGPLFVTLAPDRVRYTDSRLSTRQVTRVVANTAETAGIGDLIQGPHDLRRHFATWFASQYKSNPLAGRLLSKQLGHKRLAMTDKYILDDEEELRDVIRSPLAGRRSLW